MTDEQRPQPPADDRRERRQDNGQAEEPHAVRVPRRSQPAEPEQSEMVRGAKPGSRYARLIRAGERRFQPADQTGTIRATERATAPRTRAERFWRNVRRVAIGSPISSEEQEEQRLPKLKALAVFSSDALSSSAYATDEILLVLVAAGTGALSASIPIALAIGALLGIVAFSYRQTIRAYPNGGGSYIVARENLGDVAGLSAAAALSAAPLTHVSARFTARKKR